MVDCGGQGSFINDKLSQDYQLPRQSKQFPVSLVFTDGFSSHTGAITQYNPVLLRTANNEEPLGLDIAPVSHDVILGMPWLWLHNPAIRFRSNLMLFDSPYCRENCNHYSQTIPMRPVPHLTLPARKRPVALISDQPRAVASGPAPVPNGGKWGPKEAQ
jgi:hypothetical protein